MACQITYKNKKYGYEDFMSLLADGEFKSLVENESIDVSKLKGEYTDAVQKQSTAKVSVQPKAGDSGKVEEGKPKAEPKKVAEEGKEEEVKFSLADELVDVKKSLDNLVKEGVYTKGQVQGLLDKVKDNFEKLQEQGKPTSADVSFAYLMELIKLKSEKQGEKSFRALAKEITERLKDLLTAKERRFINNRQFQSILYRIAKANTPEKRQKILDYVNETVIFGKGAKFKARLSEARNWQQKVKDNNKKQDSKFSSARPIADSVVNIDLGELTYEQLNEFSKIASKIFPVGKEVDIANLIMLNDAFGEYQKTKEEKEIDDIETIEKLIDYIAKLKTDKIVDVPTYIQFRRTYNAMIKKRDELKSRIADEEKRAEFDEQTSLAIDRVIELADQQAEAFKEELEIFKQKYIADLLYRMRSSYVRDGLEKIEHEEEMESAKDLLDSNPKDIENLDIARLSALNTTLNNIAIGEITPQFMELLVEVHKNKYKRTNDKPALKESANSVLWKGAFKNRGRTFARRILPQFFFGKEKKFLKELTERLRTKQPLRWGTFLGNLSQRFKIGALAPIIGDGMIEEEKDAFKYREDLGKVVNDHLLPKRTKKEQKIWLHRITMFLMEARWYGSNPSQNRQSYLYSIFVKSQQDNSGIRVKTDDPINFKEKAEEYNLFLDYIRSKDKTAITEVNGEPILDVAKVEAILRGEAGIGELIDFTRGTFKRYEGRHKWISKYNGRSLIYEDAYFPFMKEGGADEIDNIENLDNFLRKASLNVNMIAGSTQEWKKQLFEPNLDLLEILINHTKMVGRNYYVFPLIREHILSIKEASDDVIREAGTADKANYIDVLARAVIDATRSRIASIYNMNNEKPISRAFKFIELGLKKGYLVKPDKFASEATTNMVRITLAMSELPHSVFLNYYKNHEFWDTMIKRWIDEKMWNAYSPEVSPKMWGLFGKKYGVKSIKKIAQKGEQIQDWMLKTPDKAVGKLLFLNSFMDMFKDITGQEFDVEKYQTNEPYRIKHRETVETAELFADSRVEELFNSKNPMSTPEKTQFINGVIKANRNNAIGRIFGFLMSFSSNDAQNVVDSYTRMRHGDAKTRLMAKRDLLAVITSNFMYGIIRRLASVAIKAHLYIPAWIWIKSLFGQGGDDDRKYADEKYVDEQRKQVFSGNYLWKYGTFKVGLDLLWGGSSNIYEYAGKIALFIFETSEGLTDEQKKSVYELFALRYIDRIPSNFGSNPEKVFLNFLPPMISGFSTDFLSTTHSLVEFNYGHIADAFMVALTDAEKKGVITKKDLYDIANVVFTGFKYTGCLPFSSIPEMYIRSELSPMSLEHRKQKRKENKGQTKQGTPTTVRY